MLSVFGLFDNIQPPYSAAFVIELYSNNGYIVTVNIIISAILVIM